MGTRGDRSLARSPAALRSVGRSDDDGAAARRRARSNLEPRLHTHLRGQVHLSSSSSSSAAAAAPPATMLRQQGGSSDFFAPSFLPSLLALLPLRMWSVLAASVTSERARARQDRGKDPSAAAAVRLSASLLRPSLRRPSVDGASLGIFTDVSFRHEDGARLSVRPCTRPSRCPSSPLASITTPRPRRHGHRPRLKPE